MPRPSARQKLLDAGLAEIHRRGFAATGVQDVATAAAVPKGSFYNHFPSKEAFGVAVIDLYLERLSSSFAVLSDTTAPPRQRLRWHFARLREALAPDRFRAGCLVGNLAAEAAPVSEPVRQRLQAVYAAWTAAVAACLREAAAAGELTTDIAPDLLADILVCAWEGAIQREKVDGGGASLDAFGVLLDRLVAP